MNKDNFVGNFSWKFAERMVAQVITLIVSVILARIIAPEDYGIITIVIIFITIANVLVTDGFGSALVQKKDADSLDFSTVLYFNIVFSVALYVLLYFTAPLITLFYGVGYEILTPVIRVLGLRVIISGVNSVQQAYVSKNMLFKTYFWSVIGGTMLSAVVGISMAYNGFGVWSIVGQYLTNTVVGTVVLSFTLKKLPLLKFSWSRLKELFGFGSKVLGASLLITLYNEFRTLLVGKIYSKESLAFFDRGKQFPQIIVANADTALVAVLFPKLSEVQTYEERVKQVAKTTIRFGCYILFPILLGLAVVSDTFVSVVLTDKWLPCVPFVRMFCILYLFNLIHTTNIQVMKSVGRSGIYLAVETVKKVVELVVLLSVAWISVEAIVTSMTVTACLFMFVNAYPNKKLVGYSIFEQLKDIAPSLIIASVMAISVYFFGFINMNKTVLLLLQIIFGIFVYIILSVLTRNKEFFAIFEIVKNKVIRLKDTSQNQ